MFANLSPAREREREREISAGKAPHKLRTYMHKLLIYIKREKGRERGERRGREGANSWLPQGWPIFRNTRTGWEVQEVMKGSNIYDPEGEFKLKVIITVLRHI